nr:hypothetical protein [Streptomyces flavovirens]
MAACTGKAAAQATTATAQAQAQAQAEAELRTARLREEAARTAAEGERRE